MKTSENGVALIKQFEGLQLEAYRDIAGVWTIGYGHTGRDVRPGMRISEREAEKLLRRDLKSREAAVSRLVSTSLNQNEFDALVSFVYNVGVEAFRGSTARRRLNKGDRQGAAVALTWWNKATINGAKREVSGLARRRAAEADLFLGPLGRVAAPVEAIEASNAIAEGPMPRPRGRITSGVAQGATVASGAGVAIATADGGPAEVAVPEIGDGADAPPDFGSESAVAPTPSLGKFIQNHEAQVQFAFLVLIFFGAAYLFYARVVRWVRKLAP